MALSNQNRIVALGPGELLAAMELSREAGWNQTTDDWQIFADIGRIFAIYQGELLASTAAIIPYGHDCAWISMVLTRKCFRGMGYGTRLLKRCIVELEAQGRSVLLDATPLGEPIYRSLGFLPLTSTVRWRGEGQGSSRDGWEGFTEAACSQDNSAFGADRRDVLTRFSARSNTGFCSDVASCFLRDGDLSWQIGPIAARTEAAAVEAFKAVIGRVSGSVMIDVPEHAEALSSCLGALGFMKQRPFLRMVLGTVPESDADWKHFAIAGPEFG